MDSQVAQTGGVVSCGELPVERETDQLPHKPTRASIMRLEREMLKREQVEIVPVHYFAEGLYAREITIPQGVLLTGKVHKSEHLNILSKGTITVWTEDGMKTLTAPATLVSRPGTKRVGWAHTEVVWTTVHATDKQDLLEIEAELIDNDLIGFEMAEAPQLEDGT